MRAALLLVTGLACSCARPVAELGPAFSSEPSCWWQDVRWEDAAPLLVPGTRRPLARAGVLGAASPWLGARVTGALQSGPSGVVLRGTWAGDGVRLVADVDVAQHAVLRAWAPVRLGSAGLLPEGAGLRVLDFREERLLVAASLEARGVFEPGEPEAAEVSCEGLTLLERPASGAPASLEAAYLPWGRRAVARASPGGVVIGAFVAPHGPTPGVLLERAGDEVRFAAGDASGGRWVGWVPASSVTRGVPPPAERFEATASAPPLRAGLRECASAQPLIARTPERLAAVGQLLPGAPFAIEREDGESIVVALQAPWLQLAEGVELLLPGDAARCPLAQASDAEAPRGAARP